MFELADREPPSFTGCPTTKIVVELGPNGPQPVFIDLPSVADNSNGEIAITYQPSEFRQPFTFRQVMGNCVD
jgi:hypothetical protein